MVRVGDAVNHAVPVAAPARVLEAQRVIGVGIAVHNNGVLFPIGVVGGAVVAVVAGVSGGRGRRAVAPVLTVAALTPVELDFPLGAVRLLLHLLICLDGGG